MERKDSKKLLNTASSSRFILESTMSTDLLAGTDIWIADTANVWMEVNVIEQKGNILVIRKRDSEVDTEIDINFEEIHKLNPRMVADMSGLNFIHEPGILSNLTFRALSKMPYTYMGTVLIAMNPLQKIDSPDFIQFVNKPLDHETPHPYALAELAYQQLCFSDTNQCLVVSGESGAGKTETAKILLKFLAERTPHTSSSSSSSSSRTAASVAQDIDKRMLQSSPLLESFGNAKTGRNNNSSRFGKLMKIFYKSEDISKNSSISAKGNRMTLAGVAIETYLLEKSRVISQSVGERNFHVFYQLLSSVGVADSRFIALHEQIKLVNDVSAYRLLSQSNCSVIEGGNDYADFENTYNSFLAYGFDTDQINGIFSILAGLLHLSNLTLKAVETDAGVKAEVENESVLELAAESLGVSSSSLAQLLTSRSMDVAGTNGTVVVLRLDVKEAVYARDASIKAIYENLFSMIVSQLNESLSNGQGNLRKNTELSFIGILDIYGFETFETNSFDQFLINYANESLQNTFNVQIFQSELKLFADENISCHITEMPENNECISLIAAKSNSIFSILDSICQLRTNRTDERFVDELHKQLGKSRYFIPVHAKEKRDTFCVKHFAGKIKYSIGSPSSHTDAESHTWVSKNNDSSPDELKSLCEGSGLAEVRRLYDHYSLDSTGDFKNAKRISRRRKSLKPSTDALKLVLDDSPPIEPTSPRLDQKNQLIRSTVASAFSHSMFQLSSLLVASNCLFIRCIKPNSFMEVDVMENEFIVNQLRSLGVLQTCEVLKLGMPTRLPYKELISALGPLIQKLPPNLIKTTENITLIACILWAFDVKRDLYKLGRTRVFFRAGQFEKIEQILQSTKDGVGARGDELVRRIIESSTFKVKADKLVAELISTIASREEDIRNSRIQVSEALKLISDAPVNEVEVPADLIELQGSIDKLAATAKQTVEQAFTRLNATVSVCNKTRDQIGAPVIAEVDSLSSKLDGLNGRVLKLGAKHTRTVTRLDALMGRNDRVRTVANYLDDSLNSTQQLLQSCSARVDEVRDGGMRCDLHYAEERARVCEESIQQVSFRLEGVELDLREIFEVFGPNSLRTNPEVGLRLVRGVLTSEVKSFLEVSREVESVIKLLNDIHQTASQYIKLTPSSPSRPSSSPSSPVYPSKQIKTDPIPAFKTPGFPVKTPSALLKAIPESAELSSTKGSSSKGPAPLFPLQLSSPTTPRAFDALSSPVTPVMDFAASMTPGKQNSSENKVTPVIDVAASTRLRALASPVSPVMDYAASSPLSRSPPRPEVSPNYKQRRTPPPELLESIVKSAVIAPPVAPSRNSLSFGKQPVPTTPPTEPNTTASRPSSRPSSRPASPSSQPNNADTTRNSLTSYNIRGRSNKSDESLESGSSAASTRSGGLSTVSMTASEKEVHMRQKKERQDVLVSEALAAAEKEKSKEKDANKDKSKEDGPPITRVRSLTSVEGDAPRPSLSIQTNRRPSITGNRNSLRHTGSGTVTNASANFTTRQSLGAGYGSGPPLMSPALTNRQSLRVNSSGAVVTPAKKRYSYTGGVISAADVMAGSALGGDMIGRRSEIATPVQVSASSKSMNGPAYDTDSGDLPEGWKEYFDQTTKRPFYVHKPTKSRQWKRPTHANPDPTAAKTPTAAVHRNSSKSDVSDDSSVADRFSNLSVTDRNTFNMTDRKMTQFDVEPDRQTIVNMLTADLNAHLHNVPAATTTTTNNAIRATIGSTVGLGLGGPMRATLARQKHDSRENDPNRVADVKQMNLDAGEQNSCLTVTKMEYLGSDNKTGYLIKKSSVLGRLRKRWFVLEGTQFQYYDRPQDESAGNGKAFLLSPVSLTTYTTTPHCFCVKSSEDSDENSHWYLTAKDDIDMESWIMAINARIHLMYAQEYGWLNRDLWEEGYVETTFWRVLKPSSTAQAGAISVRTLPKTNAPCTGEIASAGEVLECVQTIKADFNTYLRLWGDRGWIYEKHSKARYAILGKVEGTYIEDTREYRYLGKGNLPILSGPGQENNIVAVGAKSVIQSKSVFTISARFTERRIDGSDSDFTFYKLATGRGWICGQDKSGEAQIQWVV